MKKEENEPWNSVSENGVLGGVTVVFSGNAEMSLTMGSMLPSSCTLTSASFLVAVKN
jgi:hypothetical protein